MGPPSTKALIIRLKASKISAFSSSFCPKWLKKRGYLHKNDDVCTSALAYHIDSFLEVGFPIASLFGVVNLVDYDVVLFLAVRRDVERREPGFAAVLSPGEEVKDCLFLTDDALLLLSTVGDALGTENRLPIFGGYFDLVFYGSVVFELRFLGNADELLDVVPFPLEQCRVIRYGVIGAIHCGDARHDGELPGI